MKQMSFLLFILLFLYSCVGGRYYHEGPEFIEISEGIPQGIQWRENVTFFDLDNDGLKDMITPAPRPDLTSPRVFLNKKDHWIEITGQCSFSSGGQFLRMGRGGQIRESLFCRSCAGYLCAQKNGILFMGKRIERIAPARRISLEGTCRR